MPADPFAKLISPIGVPSSDDQDINNLFGIATEENEEDINALFQGRKRSPAFPNIEVSRDTNPNQVAEETKLSNELNVPIETVRANQEEAERELRAREIDTLFGKSPGTKKFYESLENARLAHDSVDQLTVIEAAANGLERGLLGVQLGFQQFLSEEAQEQTLDATRSFGEILETYEAPSIQGVKFHNPLDVLLSIERYASSRVFGSQEEAFRQRARSVSELADRIASTPMSQSATDFVESVEEADGFFSKLVTAASQPIGLTSFAAQVGIEFLPQLIVGSAATLATRSPQFGATILGAASAGTERFRSPSEFLEAAGVDVNDPKQLDNLLFDPELMEEAKKFGFTRGSIIGAFDALSGGVAGRALASSPVTDALLQLGAQSVLGGAGEATAQLATTGEIDATEVILEAVGELATAPIEVAGVGGRPILKIVRDRVSVRRAETAAQSLDETAEALQQSPLTERSPDKAAEHVAEALDTVNVTEFSVASDALAQAAEASGDPELFYSELGVTDQVQDALAYNGDVKIATKEFSQHILQNPERYALIRDHVRADPEALTVAESQDITGQTEVVEAGENVLQEVQEVTTESVTTEQILEQEKVSEETKGTIDIAEHELGMQALFRSADEAGMSETTYASYLEARQRAISEGARNKERRILKRQQKQTEKQYQEQREKLRPSVEESVRNLPLYQALFAIGRDRLDRGALLEIFQNDQSQLDRLPRVNGRRIYEPAGTKGVDPWVFAEVQGYDGADLFMFDLLDKPSFEQEVETQLNVQMEKLEPTLLSERGKIQEALQALQQPDSFGTAMAFELAALRRARGKKQLKRSVIVSRAKNLMTNFKIGNINPRSMEIIQRRESKRAAKALREGDLDKAAQSKLNQMLAHEMAKQSYRANAEIARGNKFMRRFLNKRKIFRTLPIDHLEAIRDLLAGYQFGAQQKGARNLGSWFDMKKEAEGIIMVASSEVVNADGTRNWKDLTLDEWRDLHSSVRSVYKEGIDANKFRNELIEAGVNEIVDEVVQGIDTNLRPRGPTKARSVKQTKEVKRLETMATTTKEAFDQLGVNVSAIVLNTDSLLRAIDGFRSLGTAYTFIKGGIDRAITEGYRAEQVGYFARMKEESAKLVDLFEVYTKAERNRMWRQQDIPGVRTRLNKFQQLSVILNMGNADNMQALIESKQFTELELQAVVENATKKDLDFVQSVWDFFESFRPEIRETTRRRQNRDLKMVESQPLQTQHGTYKGGYYPLAYDQEKGVLESDTFKFEEAKNLMLFGGFSSNHTADGHTKTRKGSGRRPVKLDTFVINQHVQQLVYDLEVGDAVYDSFKVLHNRRLKRAFSEAGRVEMWDALDIWLGDTITGEVHRGGLVEKSFRHIRTGTTVSALGLNLSVAALQPLGLLQSAVQIGKTNVLLGVYDLVRQNPWKMYQWVTSQSGFMAEREQTYNKDIHDAQRNLRTGYLGRVTPGKTAQFAADALFFAITKMQRFVDIVTWLGARRQGLQMFPNDPAKATLHADRMVARSQGSGNFQERTKFERGTINRAVRNSETVRVWSLFLNYFAAKLNVAYERTRRQDINPIKNPVQFVDWATDMVLLFSVEGVLAGVIKEGFDTEDDEELIHRIAWETVRNFSAGFPVVREAVSAAEGFDTGGAVGSFMGKVANLGVQASQGELDAAALKSANSVLGVIFKYPTSQIHKTGQAIHEKSQGEDVEWYEFLLGPEINR